VTILFVISSAARNLLFPATLAKNPHFIMPDKPVLDLIQEYGIQSINVCPPGIYCFTGFWHAPE
jgi:hypothetical protein